MIILDASKRPENYMFGNGTLVFDSILTIRAKIGAPFNDVFSDTLGCISTSWIYPVFAQGRSWDPTSQRYTIIVCWKVRENAYDSGLISWVVPLPRMSVTTRIIIFLMKGIPEDPYKPSFGTGILGGRGQPKEYPSNSPFWHPTFYWEVADWMQKNWGMWRCHIIHAISSRIVS